MKKTKILWKNDGWVVIQEPDSKKHILEVCVLVSDGQVIEMRKRHSRGEEEVMKKDIAAGYTLPMALDEFKSAWEAGSIKLK